jgi:hypothetical protein
MTIIKSYEDNQFFFIDIKINKIYIVDNKKEVKMKQNSATNLANMFFNY